MPQRTPRAPPGHAPPPDGRRPATWPSSAWPSSPTSWRDPVIHPGDAAGTAEALRDSESSFRLGAVAFLGIFLVDVVVAWALYVLFRPVHRDLSLLSAWLRLTYTVVLGAALGLPYAALWLAQTPSAFGESHDQAVVLALQTFDFTWVAGLAAFGGHLVVLGVLLLRAQGPRWLAWLLTAAGAAYVVDTVAHLLIADYEEYADLFLALVAAPSIMGEMSLTIWLALVAAGRRAAPSPPQAPPTAAPASVAAVAPSGRR